MNGAKTADGRPASKATTKATTKAFAISMGDTLKVDLTRQREANSGLLERQLPVMLKRLDLAPFLSTDTATVTGLRSGGGDLVGSGVGQASDRVKSELDAMFTATNILNKLEATNGGGGRVRQGAAAAERNKMLLQAQASQPTARLPVSCAAGLAITHVHRTEYAIDVCDVI